MNVFQVTIHCTTARPINVDAQAAFFDIAAVDSMDATMTALDMLMWTRPWVQMPTRIDCVKKS